MLTFEQGDECPFCEGHLYNNQGDIKCDNADCYFNKVTWEGK